MRHNIKERSDLLQLSFAGMFSDQTILSFFNFIENR